jgi:hypothetical protein
MRVGEAMHTYSSIFQPRVHKVRMLPVPPLPDELDHRPLYFVEECGGWGENSLYVRQFSVYSLAERVFVLGNKEQLVGLSPIGLVSSLAVTCKFPALSIPLEASPSVYEKSS